MQGRIWTVPTQITLLPLRSLPFFLILVVAGVIILISGYRPFPPSILGKSTTAIQIILVFAVVFAAAYPDLRLAPLVHTLIYTVAGLTVLSGFHYSFTIARRLSSS